MFGSNIIEVVIGLIFIYLLLSLLATTINEIIMSMLRARGEDLHKAISILLSDSNLNQPNSSKGKGASGMGEEFYKHPMLIKFAEKGKNNKPSYISNAIFSKVLLDITSDFNTQNIDFEVLKGKIRDKFPPDTALLLSSFVEEAEGDLSRLKATLEAWFDEMMDRASGWYKRRVQKMLILIGFLIAVILNADTFNISKTLSSDPIARAEVVKLANEYLEKQSAVNEGEETRELDSLLHHALSLLREDIEETGSVVGMGWDVEGKYISPTARHPDESEWPKWILVKLLGWMLTGLAISLGAPFWFDLLNKVMKIRGTGKKPEEKEPVYVSPISPVNIVPREVPVNIQARNDGSTPAYG